MKKTIFVIAILAIALFACNQTAEQKKDKQFNKIIKKMMNCEVKPFKYSEYGYLIEQLKNAKNHEVKFGEEEFQYAFHDYNCTYSLTGEHYSLEVYLTSGWAPESSFDVCKRWTPEQNKYNEGVIYHSIDLISKALRRFFLYKNWFSDWGIEFHHHGLAGRYIEYRHLYIDFFVHISILYKEIKNKNIYHMFLDNEDDSEDAQKFKNMMLFNFYGTDKERDEFFEGPGGIILGIVCLAIVVGIIIFAVVKKGSINIGSRRRDFLFFFLIMFDHKKSILLLNT